MIHSSIMSAAIQLLTVTGKLGGFICHAETVRHLLNVFFINFRFNGKPHNHALFDANCHWRPQWSCCWKITSKNQTNYLPSRWSANLINSKSCYSSGMLDNRTRIERNIIAHPATENSKHYAQLGDIHAHIFLIIVFIYNNKHQKD